MLPPDLHIEGHHLKNEFCTSRSSAVLLVPALDRAVALSRLPGTVYPTLTKLSITLHIAHGTGTTWLQ